MVRVISPEGYLGPPPPFKQMKGTWVLPSPSSFIPNLRRNEMISRLSPSIFLSLSLSLYTSPLFLSIRSLHLDPYLMICASVFSLSSIFFLYYLSFLCIYLRKKEKEKEKEGGGKEKEGEKKEKKKEIRRKRRRK